MVNRLKKFFSGTYLGLMLVFLYAPILILIVFSFNQSKTLGNWTGFTLDWHAQLFRTPEITDALAVTLSVAAISSIVVEEQEHHDQSLAHIQPGTFWPKLLTPVVSASTEAVIWTGMRL